MVDETETFGGALEDINALCAVVELGSISAAARHLGETKGGISRRITRLERRLGAALLARTARSVTATEEGLAFYAKARNALALLKDAAEEARLSRSVPRGHLRVTAPHDIGLYALPDLIIEFRKTYPQIIVELILSDALLDLAAHSIDLALRASNDSLPDMGYRASFLIDLQIALYASPKYLAAHPAPAKPEDLKDHDMVASWEYSGGIAWMGLENISGKRVEISSRPAMHASDYAGVYQLLLAGGGIGAIPDIDATAAVADGRLERVLSDWTLARPRLYAISIGGREAPARVRVFREFMRTHLPLSMAKPAGPQKRRETRK